MAYIYDILFFLLYDYYYYNCTFPIDYLLLFMTKFIIYYYIYIFLYFVCLL